MAEAASNALPDASFPMLTRSFGVVEKRAGDLRRDLLAARKRNRDTLAHPVEAAFDEGERDRALQNRAVIARRDVSEHGRHVAGERPCYDLTAFRNHARGIVGQ